MAATRRMTTAQTVAKRVRFAKWHLGDWPWALVFLGPNLLMFLVFMVYPVVYGFYMSLFNWRIVQPAEWVGLANYVQVFQDPLTPTLLWNSLYFVVGSVVPVMVLSLFLALLLNEVRRFSYMWRAIYFLPLVTSPVAAAAVWKWLYARDHGLLNYFLGQVGIPSIDWLFSTTWSMPALIIMTIWLLIPFNTILYMAGLQEIPRDLYEAAEIDGAGVWSKFRNITLPLITPTTFFVFLITMFGLLFGSFDVIHVMTQGGPLNSTNIFVYNVYQNAFQYFDMGYASAQAYVLFLFVFLFTLLNWRLQRKWVHY